MSVHDRVTRLYAALNVTVEKDMRKLPARMYVTDKMVGVEQDFRGGKSPADLENELHGLIALIGGLEYHLQRWASHNRQPPEFVARTFRGSPDLRLIHDLWNGEKHGYPMPHGKGRTKQEPRLANVDRAMRLQTRDNDGESRVAMQLGPDGFPRVTGDGTAMAVTTGDIIDKHGAKIDDIENVLARAVAECEGILRTFGILPPLK